MKVIFVNSKIAHYEDIFPIGLVSLCTILKEQDYDCEIVDFTKWSENSFSKSDRLKGDAEEFSDYIAEKNPDIISFYTMANSYEFSITIAKKVKQKLPNTFVIFAGPHATSCAEKTMQYLEFVDLVALGEGELTIVDLLKSIPKKEYFYMPNVCCRKDGEIILNKECDLVSDLDKMHFDYSFVDGIEKFNSAPIEAGRGCPFSCTFCSTKLFWKQKYRLKSADKILSEMDFLYNEYGIKKFNMEHDSLTANKKQIFALCNKLIEANRGYTWGCSSRVDVLSEELIDLLYKAGCRSVFLGIETGSQRIQKEINKNLDLSKVKYFIPLLMKKGMAVRCSFVYGFPGETKKDICDTLTIIDYLLQNGIYDISLFKLTFLPETELYNHYKDELVMQPIEDTSYFALGDRGEEYAWAIQKYPELFPQYCKHKKPLAYKSKYIECFVNYFLMILCKKLKTTAKYLREKYENIYELYEAMFECCEEIDQVVASLLAKKITNEEFENLIIQHFLKFIQMKYFELDKDALLTFIQCDMDIIGFYHDTVDTCSKTYDYDIIEYLTKKKIKRETVMVTLFRKENKIYLKRRDEYE